MPLVSLVAVANGHNFQVTGTLSDERHHKARRNDLSQPPLLLSDLRAEDALRLKETFHRKCFVFIKTVY